MRQGVNAVKQHDVMTGQQLDEAPIVGLPVGEVEVAQYRHLLQRSAPCGVDRHRCDPGRIRVRAGDLDPDAGLSEGGAMDGPADGGHLVPALDEPAGQDRERADVASRADGRDGDPHLDRGDAPGRHPRSVPRSHHAPDLQVSLDAPALTSIRLEQLEHPGVVGARLAGQCPRHAVRDVIVAHADRVAIARG